jgi:hypothetical protein
MKWVTREKPKIDRVACPWLITRFIDRELEFLYVPAEEVLAVAQSTGAIPCGIHGVEMSHVREACSFDAFLRKYRLDDPALHRRATIIRGADTARLNLASMFTDDHELLARDRVWYDALFAWCRCSEAAINQEQMTPA